MRGFIIGALQVTLLTMLVIITWQFIQIKDFTIGYAIFVACHLVMSYRQPQSVILAMVIVVIWQLNKLP